VQFGFRAPPEPIQYGNVHSTGRKGAINKETIMATATTTLEKRETFNLIGSDKVEGTNVCRSNGEKIGSIERLMIDKLTGKVAYAVMSFGGFLGIGHDHYPIPWSLLKYNPRLEGYEVNITEQQLHGAPKYGRDENWDWSDSERGRKVYDYYKVPFYM
jgi:PRC-barrel domain protein